MSLINQNLFLKELKRNRKNLVIWTSIVVAFTVLVLSVFPFMAEMGKDMTMLIDNMPVELQKAMGMTSQTWSNILGFYSTYFGIYIVVLVSIYAASTATTIISKEEKEGTSEFLFTKPISRRTIFWSKMLALLVLTLSIYLVQTISAVIGVYLFKEGHVDWEHLFFMQLNGFFLVTFFTAISLFISMFMQVKTNFMGMVVGLTFGSYILNAVAKSTEATKFLGYFSPFHYIEFDVLSAEYQFYGWAALSFTTVVTVLLFSSLIKLKTKNLAG